MGTILSLVCFLLLISILVAVHEFGHFYVARKNGVFVEAFSVGYGPVLLERTDRRGTKWRFSLLPIGGYVRMLGDADASSIREIVPDGVSEEDMQRMSLHRKKPWQKLLVAAGGPVINFIFAIFVFIFIAMYQGLPVNMSVITPVSEDCVAYKSGLRDGDEIIEANGNKVAKFDDLKEEIRDSVGRDLRLKVLRGDDVLSITARMYDENSGKPIQSLGVVSAKVEYEKTNFIAAVKSACETTYVLASENMKAIGQMLIGKRSTKDVGGVISIFQMSASSAEAGVFPFIYMLGLLSVILGAINLLPIPVLDGGTVLISLIEWIVGRPLNQKLVNIVFYIGLAVVALLMLVGIWNDLTRLSFFKTIAAFFTK
jgi:regulator of sigma E protease